MTRRQFFAGLAGALTLNPKKLWGNLQGLLKPASTFSFQNSIHPLVSYDLGEHFAYRMSQNVDTFTRKIIDEEYAKIQKAKPPSG